MSVTEPNKAMGAREPPTQGEQERDALGPLPVPCPSQRKLLRILDCSFHGLLKTSILVYWQVCT